MTTPQTENPCIKCGKTLNGHSGIRSYGTYKTHDTAYCLRYLRNDRDERDATIAALVEAGEALLNEAHLNMQGGKGHLLDDMRAALAKAKPRA